MGILTPQFKKLLNAVSGVLPGAATIIEIEMHDIVAIDTGMLNESINIDPVETTGDTISIKVGSSGVSYAKDVEFGDGNYYDYHRYKKIVHSGVGQYWAKRSVDATRDIIDNLFRSIRI